MALKVLCDHILKEGRCMEGGILKVDLFLNHQMDPYLMKQTAIEFIRRFADLKINKILTIEASGIAPAVMLGYMMELPVVFAKKKIPVTMDDYYQTEVRSFTPGWCHYRGYGLPDREGVSGWSPSVAVGGHFAYRVAGYHRVADR